MKQFCIYAFIVLTCAACATAPAPKDAAEPGDAPPAEAQAPQNARAILEEVLASNPVISEFWRQESEGLPEQKLSLPAKFGDPIGLELRAKATPVPKINESNQLHSFTADIGSDHALNCHYLPGRVDAAATLRSIGNSLTSVISPEQQLPAVIDVEVVSGAPMLSIVVGYFTEQDGAVAMGALKAYVATFPASSLWCVHDELGYSQTVHDNMVTMVTSLMKTSEARYPEAVQRRRVSVTSFSGQPFGYSEEWVVQTETGMRTTSYMSMLTSREPGSFASEDSVNKEYTDAEGYLLQQSEVSSENNELTVQMQMQRADDGSYHAKGTVQGKPVEFDLGAAHKLPGTLLEETTLQQFVEQNPNGSTTTLHYYDAGIAPDQLLPLEVEIVDAQKRQLKVNMMGVELTVWNDARGRMEKSTADLGAIQLEIDHKYTHPDN